MQASVSVPEGVFYIGENVVEKSIGYYRVINDMDTFEKLHKGFVSLQSTPDRMAAQSFAHPWLGPNTAKKQDKLEKLIF